MPVVVFGKGELMLIDGASFRYSPRREAVATRPPALRPWATRMLRPPARRTPATVNGRGTLLSDPVIVAATPLTSALTTPAPAVPLTAIESVAETKFSAGVSMLIDGSPVTRCSVMVAGVPVGVPFASVQTIVIVFGP